MVVFWDWAPGPYWCSAMARFVGGVELFFEAAWWWVVFTRGSLGTLKATGLNSWEICWDNLLPEQHSATSTPSPAFHLLERADMHRTSCLPFHTNSKNTMRSKHPPEPKADTPKWDRAHSTHTHKHTRSGTETSTDTVKLIRRKTNLVNTPIHQIMLTTTSCVEGWSAEKWFRTHIQLSKAKN